MKKIIIITFIFLNFTTILKSEIAFNLSCKGELTISGGHTGAVDSQFYFEDIKVYIDENKKVLETKTTTTNNWHLRGSRYIDKYNLKYNKDSILFYQKPNTQDGYKTSGFEGQISLISGMYFGRAVITEIKNNIKHYYKFNAQCEGHQNIYAFLNDE